MDLKWVKRITEYEVPSKAEFLFNERREYGRNNQKCKRRKTVYP